MHAELGVLNGGTGHQIGAEWVLLGQICSEVHLFPLVALDEVQVSGEAEFTQVPAPDEVDLSCLGVLIDREGMAPLSDLNLLGIAL